MTLEFSCLKTFQETYPCLFHTLYYSTIVVGAFKIFNFFKGLAAIFLDCFIYPSVNFHKYGGNTSNPTNWCVITGASDGIGKEYVFQFANRGFNLLLISRTESKLQDIQKELKLRYPRVKVQYLSIDVSTDSLQNYSKISQVTDNLPITVLVNNVGQSHSIPVPFLETEDKEINDIITINDKFTLKITKIIVPRIIETLKKNHNKSKGLILTMGSFGGLLPTPFLATYSGSKAFLQSWSNALSGELSRYNVDVELVLSYLVTSKMSKIRKSSLLIPTPKQFVASVLRSCGRRCGAQERYGTTTPYWSHALYHYLIEQTVGVYSAVANKINYQFHWSIRKRALKKRQQKKLEGEKTGNELKND
ncbi:probable Very-long-chain 3-oxoacyl-CoA reductase [Saccharomycodes ludwigii]|uniref:Very-long-chain 3-oxoacyl-CoA reductase n=1 Tax=Saccharomycodes ludwigii TaxID=36035 RepID=A0A376B9R1_9ASCO|nr:hypothetical protein SCDLUD_001986 [Saccharomycodes ludwigii]KAH3902171.1 hypothetical protein SCDLUD_001986 [Saccharomycodes ludwigii]SSD61397.1 probable Very-long-chain 3-oxoacyl-CoA reductase [Saccharomycodes ludwigii]